MNQFFYIFIYLNIYTAFLYISNAQELNLQVRAEIEISNELRDSLNYRSAFSDYASLQRETDSISKKLLSFGYINSALLSIGKENDSSYLALYHFGQRSPYITIYYRHEDFNKAELQRVGAKVSDSLFTIDFPNIETTLLKLTALKAEGGKPFAKLHLENISANEENELSARLVLDSGEARILDSIVIKGYDKFPRSFLKYYAGVRTGRAFNQRKLITQNETLDNLGFVSTIKSPEVLFRKDATTVFFYLKKQNNNLFDGILGFSTNEESRKLELNGYLYLELNNNLNYGEQLLINYKADGNEQQNFRVKVNLPYLFKSPFGLGAELKIFKRDSSFVTTDQQLRLSYQIKPTSSAYIGYKGYESSNLLDIVIVGSPIEDYTARYGLIGVNYLKLQRSPLFPVKTTLAADAEIGKRDLKNSSDAQQRLGATLNHIFNLNYKNSFFLQSTTQLLISDYYLLNELFQFGGINSMRGFDENSIDASLYSVLNTEYRYMFNPSIYIHSIIDLGYFQNQVYQQKEKLYSFGIGMGLLTKAGVFKLNLANGNSESQDFSFNNVKIHLSLTSRF